MNTATIKFRDGDLITIEYELIYPICHDIEGYFQEFRKDNKLVAEINMDEVVYIQYFE